MNEKWLAVRPRDLRVLGRREQLADRIEGLQVGHRVRARRAADRRLVDQHDVADELVALEPAMRADLAIPVALGALQRGVEHVVHERRLARSADAGDDGQRVERDLDVDVLQVVLARADQRGCAAACPRRRVAGTGIASSPRRYLAVSDRGSFELLERARKDHAAAMLAGAQPHVDDVVGDRNHVGVVLDDEHRVALIAQLPQDLDQPLVVARVQADRRLVEHVQRARPAPSPSDVARLMRCASPPESVDDSRSSVR